VQAGMDDAAPGLARALDMRNGDGAGDADRPRVGSVVAGTSWNPTAGLRQYQPQEPGAWQGGASVLPEDTPAHISAFVSRMAGPAQSAARATGVPAKLILGQAALESGWGRREIAYPDGSTTFNVFGIKAGANWKGQVAEITTTEYIDGQPQKVRARFRAYASYDEAFADYGRLLSNNPRYAEVLAAATPDDAARGLQRAGYATDPAYGEKLVRIMRKVPV
ncbi:flagellar assembly peptidoglycan hydrolase FlgJ, partial [Cupriavidus sp. 2MCAB6]